MPDIRVLKLHDDAIIPTYQTKGAAGFDLSAIEDVTLKPGETKLIKTGLAFEIQEGYEVQIRPRSGLSLKTTLRVANAPGTIDSDYRGEVCIILTNTSSAHHYGFASSAAELTAFDKATVHIKKGDRVAQGVLCAVEQAGFLEVNSLDSTDRGEKGFGSTDKN